MNIPIVPRRFPCILAAALALGVAPGLAAQNGRPAPEQPESQFTPAPSRSVTEQRQDSDNVVRTTTIRSNEQAAAVDNGSTRRPVAEGKVQLGFNDVSVEETIPFIVEATGKVVMPINLQILRTRKITLINDQPIERAEALDLLFTAFRLNGVGVIETDTIVILDQLESITRIPRLPVLDASVDVLKRMDVGTNVIKIFPITNVNAEAIGERIGEILPDNAVMSVDLNSNQIVIVGDVGLCQQVQRLIYELDFNYVNKKTQTFRLAHADALEIETNILDLFETDPSQAPRTTGARVRAPRTPGRQAAAAQPSPTTIGPVVEMRLTVNTQQNSVTVTAEPSVIESISTLIANHWDLPRAPETSKVYTLRYTDAVKMQETLSSILGTGGGTTGRVTRSPTGGQAGAGGRTDVSQAISGIYQIDVYRDANQLVVLSKTTEAIEFLDYLINELDQPTKVGMPMVIELKHADAVSLSEELNALLQVAGGGANIPRPGRGLTGQGIGQEGGAGIETGGDGQGGQAGRIDFPWQRSLQEERSPESALIGQARIVPIVRQNALAILAPPAKQESMRELIEQFDKPGRQVMISAIIAEVSLTDATALGLRLSSSDQILGTENPDFGIGGGAGVNITEDPLFNNTFTSSVLDANFNINVFVQALARKNALRILQQPRVFTSDNQEAQFFDGQDVPFLSSSQVTDVGTVTETFDRREVGVRLNIRPRITVQQDVDLEIDLEISSVVPGTSGSGVIIDRRQTTTQIIVKDGQTIVLSGILRDIESDVKRKIPLLGDIPIIGALFSSIDRESTQAELVAFITPTVVDNPEVNDENFNRDERERLRDLSKPLKEQMKDLKKDRREPVRDRIVDPVSQRPLQTPAQEQPLSEVLDELSGPTARPASENAG